MAGPTAFPGCAASTPPASRRSSPTRGGSPGCTPPTPASSTSPRSRARTHGTCSTRAPRLRPARGVEGIARGGALAAPRACARRHRGRQRGLLRRRVGGPPRRRRRRRSRPAHRALPRRLPAPGPRAPRAGPLAHLPRAGPVAAVPRRSPDQAHRRRRADRADGPAGRRPRRLSPRDAQRSRPARHAHVARHLANARQLVADGRRPSCATPPRAPPSCAPPLATCRSCESTTCSPPSPAFARRRSGATASSSTISSSPTPSGRCTCATRPRRQPPPRWRSRATSPTTRTPHSGWRGDVLLAAPLAASPPRRRAFGFVR